MINSHYLNTRGYVVKKSELSLKEINNITSELTVAPIDIPGYGPESEPFQIYQESTNKLYLPKFYGLQKFGPPHINKIPDGVDIDLKFTGNLRKKQSDAIDLVLKNCRDPTKMGAILCLNCGEGKCFAINTPILMFDGSVKMVQDLIIGDAIMGDNSTQRIIKSTCVGKEMMYEISNSDGDNYIVNESHILSLKSIKDEFDIIDIPLTEVLKKPSLLDKYYGYKNNLYFQYRNSIIDPYLIGYSIIELGAIPTLFKINSTNVRRSVLAGIIDNYNGFVFRVSENQILEDIIFLVKSIGLCIRTANKQVSIYGNNLDKIPIRTYKGPIPEYTINTLINKIAITKLNIGNYYGFELHGHNKRFLLGNFIVTHNTVCAINMISVLSKKTLIILHKEFLINQWKERINEFLSGARIGLIKAQIIDVKNKDIILASLQSLSMKDYDPEIFQDIGLVIVDECHRSSSKIFSQAFLKTNFKYSIGLTATPKRKDGLTKVFIWNIGDIAFKSEKRNDNLTVKLLKYYKPDPVYSQELVMYNRMPNIVRMLNNICEYIPRVDFIINIILDILNDEPDRRIIIMSDRRNHLILLKNRLDTNNIESGYYVGGMKEHQLVESESKKIILSTFCMAKEGLDVKGLDTLILASPKTDVIQITGRILRTPESERIHVPLVIDIIDAFSVFVNQAKKRFKYYKSCKYDVIDQDNIFLPVKDIKLPGQYLFKDEE